MCIGLHTLPPCLLFCGNYILHESEYDVHIFCVALDIIIYLPPQQNAVPPQQNAVPPQQNAVPPQQAFVPAYDPYDHTAEFDPKDISDNKVFAMLCYLMDFIGIIVALLATHSSKYTMFHVRQALKITVVSILSVFVLIIPFLGWIAFPILQGIIWVIKIISFFQICSGKAKEPAIIRSFGFLR